MPTDAHLLVHSLHHSLSHTRAVEVMTSHLAPPLSSGGGLQQLSPPCLRSRGTAAVSKRGGGRERERERSRQRTRRQNQHSYFLTLLHSLIRRLTFPVLMYASFFSYLGVIVVCCRARSGLHLFLTVVPKTSLTKPGKQTHRQSHISEM